MILSDRTSKPEPEIVASLQPAIGGTGSDNINQSVSFDGIDNSIDVVETKWTPFMPQPNIPRTLVLEGGGSCSI